MHVKESSELLDKVALVANQTTSQLVQDSIWP
ncbi:unnamed protein product, partial [Rotaria sp. Silwood1]